ncbi:MAG: hypothetical protein Q4D16_22075 [Eubacteriales bacterium]|nr:hypothetical protein [Eubacteriales bacterium]
MKNHEKYTVIQELKTQFPKPPEHFQLAVREAVEEQLRTDVKKTSGKRKKYKKILLLSAAVLVLSTSTFAAVRQGLLPYLEKWIRTEDPAEQLQTDIKETADMDGTPYSGPLWTISQAWYDGGYLIFYAEASQEGLEYDLGSDHIYINGQDFLLNYIKDSENPGNYFCNVDLTDQNLEGVLDIVIPLKVWKDNNPVHKEAFSADEAEEYMANVEQLETQEIRFTVEENGTVRKLSGKTAVLKDGEVEIKYAGAAPTATRIDFTYHMWGEDGQEKLSMITGMFQIEDSKGNIADSMKDLVNFIEVKEPYKDNKGDWCLDYSIQVKGLDKETESLTIRPYRMSYDKEGKAVPGTEELLDFGEFTITL